MMTLERFGTDTSLTWREGVWAGSLVPRSVPSAAGVSSILGDRGYNRKSFLGGTHVFFCCNSQRPILTC